MGRILSEKSVKFPRLAGPSEEMLVPDRLRINGRVPTWDSATRRFRALAKYLEENEADAFRVLDFDTFTSSWANAAWSELYRIDQKACGWAQSTVLITFSGSYWLNKSTESFLPPVTYLARLQSSKQARQKALSRALDDVARWQSVRTIGGTGYNGYPRIFLGLYLSDPVEKDVFEPVLDSHVRNSPIAEADAHDPQRVVTIDHSPEHKSRLIHGLGKRIPSLNSKGVITSESWEMQKIATALHGGGWRPYSFGNST